MEKVERLVMILRNAQVHARRLFHEYVGCEHVLLAMIDEASNLGVHILRMHCDVAELRSELLSRIVPGPEMVTVGKLPMTPALKAAIDVAESAAAKFNSEFLHAEHVLIGIIDEKNNLAATVLREFGVDSVAVFETLCKTEGTAEVLQSELSWVETALTVSIQMNRCLDVLHSYKHRNESLRLATEGLHQSLRWFAEYRMLEARRLIAEQSTEGGKS